MSHTESIEYKIFTYVAASGSYGATIREVCAALGFDLSEVARNGSGRIGSLVRCGCLVKTKRRRQFKMPDGTLKAPSYIHVAKPGATFDLFLRSDRRRKGPQRSQARRLTAQEELFLRVARTFTRKWWEMGSGQRKQAILDLVKALVDATREEGELRQGITQPEAQPSA